MWGEWTMVYVGMSTQHHLVLSCISCAWPELRTSGTRNAHRTRLGAENSTAQRHAQTNWMSSWKMVLQTVPCMILLEEDAKTQGTSCPTMTLAKTSASVTYHCIIVLAAKKYEVALCIMWRHSDSDHCRHTGTLKSKTNNYSNIS